MCVYDIFVPYAGALVEHPSGLARSAAVSPEQLRSAGLQFSSATLSGNFEVTGPHVILDLCCLKTHKLVLLPEGKFIHVFFSFLAIVSNRGTQKRPPSVSQADGSFVGRSPICLLRPPASKTLLCYQGFYTHTNAPSRGNCKIHVLPWLKRRTTENHTEY